jgi:hypothetical protein
MKKPSPVKVEKPVVEKVEKVETVEKKVSPAKPHQ